mmetsp:Transcript_14870/g.30347  ORF Transcript_14870/g.30347 Transcript_14870/m.30347 type:complete len:345 (+) Transcript_14870:43-1077(+)
MPRRPVTKRVIQQKSSCGCCTCLITAAIVVGVGIFLAVYLTDAESPSDLVPENFHPGDFIPTLEEFIFEDPFNATTPEEANRWAGTTGTGGLKLEIVNALEEKWYPFFDLSVAQWDDGNPDVLTLSTSMGRPDSDCTPILGKMKVCNGNYGDTRWKGLNIVTLQNDEITQSSAKMNEYYLAEGGDDKRQYTMCHEIGHGFGLPHTDENFNNRNTGECMDYTRTPSDNMQPGPENFDFLAQMYGTVNGGSGNSDSNPTNNGGGRGLLRKLWTPSTQTPKVLDIPTDVLEKITQEVSIMEKRTDGQEHLDGWFEEHRSEFGSLHTKYFGDGYSVRVAKLLVAPDEV